MKIVPEERCANARDHWPVFVISLTDAEPRRAAISAQLSALSIPFEFIDAIDGRSGLPAEHEAKVDRVATERVLGRPMSDAEYAASLSHMLAHQRIIAENLAGAIVLEDDAIIGHAFAVFRAKRCYEAGDLLQMDHVFGYIWKGAKTVPLFDGVVAAVAAKNAALATGYSISQRGARYLQTHGQPIISPADWPADVTGLPALLTLPCIVGHSLERRLFARNREAETAATCGSAPRQALPEASLLEGQVAAALDAASILSRPRPRRRVLPETLSRRARLPYACHTPAIRAPAGLPASGSGAGHRPPRHAKTARDAPGRGGFGTGSGGQFGTVPVIPST